MRKTSSKFWILSAMFAVGAIGAVAAWQTTLSARERRRQLAHGQIRPITSEWIKVQQLSLHARVALPPQPSYASPIILVHGIGTSSAYFVPTIERLANRFIVYAVDLPGHGKSEAPSEPFDVRRFADTLMAWMDVKGFERASLIGNSTGCQIVVDAALRYPERVERAVLIGPTLDPASRSLSRFIGRLLLDFVNEPLPLNLLFLKDYAVSAKHLLSEWRLALLDPVDVKLPDITAPVMLVRGNHDPLVSQRWFDDVARLIGTDRATQIPNVSHAVPYTAAQPLVEAITPFLLEGWYNFDKAATNSNKHPTQ